MIDDLISQATKGLMVCEVGRIVSVSGDLKTVNVQPLGKLKFGDLPEVDQPVLQSVPIQYLNFGKYAISVEPEAGSDCLLIFNNRNLDGLRNNGGTEAPTTTRAHDLQDAICLIGGLSTRIGKEIKKGLTLENEDYFLNIQDGDFEINCKKLKITASGGIDITAAKTDFSGIVNAAAVNASGISLSTHVHGGVASGGSSTARPS